MPIIYQKTSRRHFVRVVASSTGAIAAMSVFPSFIFKDRKTIKLALLSDTHIPEDKTEHYRGFYPYNNLKEIVSHIQKSDVQSAIITGDLARLEGKPGDYLNLKELIYPLAQTIPLAMVMGNHDRRDHFLDAFTETPGERQDVNNKYILVMEHPEVRFILLDSLIYTNLSPALGLLGKAQRKWLKTYLNLNNDKAVVLIVHHTLNDGDGDLQDSDKLFNIISPHKQVKAIVYGHSHEYKYDVRDDIHLINLPATGYNFRPTDPIGWVEASFTATNGIFKLHATDGNRDTNGSITKLDWR